MNKTKSTLSVEFVFSVMKNPVGVDLLTRDVLGRLALAFLRNKLL